MTVKTYIGEIHAEPDVLNALALMAWDSEELRRTKGMRATAAQMQTVAHEIYQALKDAGVYDTCGNKEVDDED